MDRFFKASDDDIAFFYDASKSKNTKSSTNNWLSVFQKWATSRDIIPEMKVHSPEELNKILEKFYVELRKVNGKEYEPSCLRVMLTSLDR